jgi:hypothetical protein
MLVLAKPALTVQTDVRHVPNQNVRSPFQLLRTIVDAWFQKYAIVPIGGRCPGDQRSQQNRNRMLAKPKSQGVLFVTDVITALTVFAAACANVGSMGEVLA